MKVSVEIHPNAMETAEAFCDLKSDEMAIFFNEVARISAGWDGSFAMQLQWITDDTLLSKDARHIMYQIGEYSEKE